MSGFFALIDFDLHENKNVYTQFDSRDFLNFRVAYQKCNVCSKGLSIISLYNTNGGGVFENDKVIVFLYGICYSDNDEKLLNVTKMSSLYLDKGEECFVDFNGSFVVIIYDKITESFYLITDRIGSIPVYSSAINDRRIVLSSEAKNIVSFREIEPGINYESLIDTLCFGRVKFTCESIYKGIRTIKPGTITKYFHGSETTREYFRYYPKSEGAIPGIDESCSILHAIINRAIDNSEKTALFLSGGMDSRLLASFIKPESFHKIIATSFGMKDNDESKIAAEVASKLGIQIIDINLTKRDFINYAERASLITEGLDLWGQGYLEKVTSQLKNEHGVSEIIDGMEIGVSLGGDYLSSSYNSITIKELPGFLFKKFYIHMDPINEVFEIDALPYIQACTNNVIDEVNMIDGVFNKLDYIFIENYTRQVMRLRHRIIRNNVNIVPLTATKEYLNLVMNVPGKIKQERKYQLILQEKVNKELLKIPYHSTMLPLNSPRNLWELGSKMLFEHESFSMAMWREHRINIPYNHYFTNFSEWLRVDEEMKNFVGDLLQSRESRLIGTIINKKWSDRIIFEHQSGIRDHRTSILYLMSIELFLRSSCGKYLVI